MEEDLKYSIDEYVGLWKDHGIEPLEHWQSRFEKKIRQGMSSTIESKNPQSQPICSLEDVRIWLGDCRRCGLCDGRTKIVFGNGSATAKLMFVGEAPGADEDAEGLPFVGRAGNLLTKIIEAMGYSRNDVYITNIVKCRPPNNRAPQPEEATTCLPFLKSQIQLVQPSVLVALGGSAATYLLNTTASISSLRGKLHPLPWIPTLPVMPTYHPAYLLRNPSAKRFVWEDLKLVKSKLEEK